MSQDNVLRQLLEEIQQDPAVSQRKLASSLGLSIGSVNWHLKRCAGKGWIKLRQAPVKRYLYYLTPEGFGEKARLTAEFLRVSFDILRVGRQQYEALTALCEANGWSDVALLGDSELAELAMLVMSRSETVRAHCVLDPRSTRSRCAGLPVVTGPEQVLAQMPAGRLDALVGTHFEVRLPKRYDLDALRTALALDAQQLLIPPFIH
ncbi:MAG: winged helix-turn-helix transcriptional regulator [Alphaproteobacteria bacterium]